MLSNDHYIILSSSGVNLKTNLENGVGSKSRRFNQGLWPNFEQLFQIMNHDPERRKTMQINTIDFGRDQNV